jgi:hypothetical protein
MSAIQIQSVAYPTAAFRKVIKPSEAFAGARSLLAGDYGAVTPSEAACNQNAIDAGIGVVQGRYQTPRGVAFIAQAHVSARRMVFRLTNEENLSVDSGASVRIGD